MCSIAAILGILSLKRSTPVLKKADWPVSTPPNRPFLSREQTDEWKGWMQFLILIYHYTGASKTLAIYKTIRICVTSYLFMTGYGHTLYFLRRGDYSLRRHSSVLIRLNLLSCILPYIMRTDYLFYYFAPLTSFWYVVVAATLSIQHSRNKSMVFLLSKITFATALVTILNRTSFVSETLFYLLQKTCRIDWDLQEWRFRIHLDSFIIFAGMAIAVVFLRVSDSKWTLDMGNLPPSSSRKLTTYLHLLGILAAGLGTAVFWLATSRLGTKEVFNWWMPYTSWVPVLSFVVLRNSTRGLRNIHSSLFAWLGKHSLETFILQFHIWLAADTKGLLVLGIFRTAYASRVAIWLDFACITVIFLWISWLVAAATNTATAWIVDPSAGRPDIDIDSETGKILTLPRNKSQEHLNAHLRNDHGAHLIEPRVLKLSNSATALVRQNLKVRLGLIIATLWILNIVSSRINLIA